jgi:hypothetical protein
VVLFAPSTGQAGASLRAAVRLVQTAGSRPIVVAARSSTWSGDASNEEGWERDLAATGGRRTGFHLISAGDDLARRLAAA